MSRQKQRLLNDQVADVIGSVESWKPEKAAQEEIRRKQLGYLRTHEHRRRYQTWREAGYHIGSGGGESGCKGVVQQRMKAPGMRWEERGAETMLHLRATWCSGDMDDLYSAARRTVAVA